MIFSQEYTNLIKLIDAMSLEIQNKQCSLDFAKGYCLAAVTFSRNSLNEIEYNYLLSVLNIAFNDHDLCHITCFDRVLHLIQKLPTHKLEEAYHITCEDSLIDLLDFCVANNCFTEEQSTTLYEGIIMWEDLNSNYYEENYEKLMLLYDKIGLTKEICQQFSEEIEREE